MKITIELMDEMSDSMSPYDATELVGMLPEEHRKWVYGNLRAAPPEGTDVVEDAVNAYLALKAPELGRFRKRIRELTNERI